MANAPSLDPDRFRNAFEYAATGIAITDADGRFLQVNKSYCEIVGYAEHELLGTTLSAITHPADAERTRASLGTLLSEAIPAYVMEKRYIRKNQTVVWVRNSVSLVRDSSGRPVQTVAITEDITERKRFEESLRESDELARRVMETSLDCVLVLDLEGNLLSINGEGSRQFQLDDLESRLHRPWTGFWKEEEKALVLAAISVAQSGGRGSFEGWCYTPAKADPKWWDVQVAPLLGSQGAPARLLVVLRDNTERRLHEERIRQASKLESLAIMASGIAHDFNNLLTGILGSASILSEDLEGPSRDLADDIVRFSAQAAGLTRQLLAYSGKGRFITLAVDLSAQVRELLPELKPLLKGAELLLNLAGNLPAVDADVNQIVQMIVNLVTNAVESIDRPDPVVAISTGVIDLVPPFPARILSSENLKPGPYVFLRVEDNGSGMSEQTAAKIFDPFFTTKFTGRGLGLAAVSGIVRGHGGALRLRSEEGKGSAFEVFLPA